MNALAKLPSKEIIAERLPIIFPVGTSNRNNCIRGIAVSTVFTMLYVNAVEGSQIYCSPIHVYRMTEEQSHKTESEDRINFYNCVLKRGCTVQGKRWYEDTTRESIRDETLRDGLIQLGAAKVKKNVPTTSSKPRYTLQRSFAELFNPDLNGEGLEIAISKWQEENLTVSALTRLRINQKGISPTDKILVSFPNGETRHMEAGPSSIISKNVIEEFTRRYLTMPFVLWLSESGNKVPHRDDQLASNLGLIIDASLNLPDIILVDVGPKHPLIIFVEVVATDGAITSRRVKEIYEITDKGGFNREQVVFVTAYMDRQAAGFKKTIPELEWNSFVWFASEPDNLFILKKGVIALSEIINQLYNAQQK